MHGSSPSSQQPKKKKETFCCLMEKQQQNRQKIGVGKGGAHITSSRKKQQKMFSCIVVFFNHCFLFFRRWEYVHWTNCMYVWKKKFCCFGREIYTISLLRCKIFLSFSLFLLYKITWKGSSRGIYETWEMRKNDVWVKCPSFCLPSHRRKNIMWKKEWR